MLLNQLREISKIDSRIQKIHQELAGLYERREAITKAGAAFGTAPVRNAAPAEKEYARLVNVWHRYGLKPPTYKYLKPALQRGLLVMQEMLDAKPELKGRLGLVLVPPTKELQQALAGRQHVQRFVQTADSISSDLPRPDIRLKWRLVVAYTAKEGLSSVPARMLLADKSYIVGGHDARALGQQEYMALSLHATEAIDQTGWSMLLRDADEKAALLPCASFSHGGYRFDRDDLDNIFGDTYFRPAVEV